MKFEHIKGEDNQLADKLSRLTTIALATRCSEEEEEEEAELANISEALSKLLTRFVEMEHQQSRVEMFEKFTWKIENFSRLSLFSKKFYSAPFVLCDYPWRILLYPYGSNLDCLSIYLDAVQSVNLPRVGSRDVKFRLVVFNQINSNMTITKETVHKFNARENDWGFTSFMPLAELNDPQKGFLVKDVCIVGVEVSVYKSRHENHVDQAATLSTSLTSGGQTANAEVPRSEPKGQGQNLETLSPVSTQLCLEPNKHTDVKSFSSSIGELMDFRGLGQLEKDFIPLLEEVCSQHPSLVDCQQKRSRKFTEWAFAALGRVLYFLKTKKVKDMNDQACKDLKILWEEVETFRFDLTWLEPHVQSALGMKSYVEKAMQVKKMKENVVALELEMERHMAKLDTAKVDLDTRRDSLKAEGFEERGLDAELGYGRP